MSELPVVKATGLSVFQGKNPVLANVSFSLLPGEFVYLIGKTGSGKSSLMQMMYADLPVLQGSLQVAGYSLESLKPQEIPFLRRKLGIVFQDFQLFTDRNVFANLEFVMRATGWKDAKAIQDRVADVLHKVGLNGKVNKMPFELSGGEQQRLAIARALVNKPALILADEPTGNLDPESSSDIVQLLMNLSKEGTSVLMATHDYSLFPANPARTLRCEAGRVQETSSALS